MRKIELKMLPYPQVDFSPSGPDENFDVGNPQRFGVQFADRVANPKDIVQFHKKRVINRAWSSTPFSLV